MTHKTFVALVSIIFAFQLQAAELPAEVTAKKSDVGAMSAPTTADGDLDKEVTDIKLRASSGAKRQWSSSLFMNYDAGSLSEPDSKTRPNVGEQDITYPVGISMDIGARYRLNKNKSFFLATGLYQAQPFTDEEGPDSQLEISTAMLVYNNTFAMDALQIGSSWRVYYLTKDQERKDYGMNATVGYSISAINPISTSKFSGGVRIDMFYTDYYKTNEMLEAYQTDYGIAMVPSLQWNAGEKWNVFTSLNIFRYSHNKSLEEFDMVKKPETQYLGVGYAIVRDFYVSPSIQFEPLDFDADETTISLSTSINL